MLKRLATNRSGAAAAEYALLAAVLAGSLVAVLLAVGGNLDRNLQNVGGPVPHRLEVRT